MDLLRLSSQNLEFEYSKFENMQASLTLYNDSNNPIAYKFKATNLNIFLVRPPLGIVNPKQSIQVNILLHCKVLEQNSPSDFNEKLQITSCAVPSALQDAGPIFLDRSRRFEKQKINIVILSKDRKIVAQSQSQGSSNQMFQSVNKQFGSAEPTRVVAIPTADKARSEAEYFSNKFEVLQQEVQLKEQELQQLQKLNSALQQRQEFKTKSGKKELIIFLLLLLGSFFVSFNYQDQFKKMIAL